MFTLEPTLLPFTTSTSLSSLSFYYFFSLFFYCSGPLRPLHSFPTRRSSDLAAGKTDGAFIHGLPGELGHLFDFLRSGHAFEIFRSEEHTSELQSLRHLVCRLLLEKKKKKQVNIKTTI